MCLVVHPRVVDSLSPDMSTIALGALGSTACGGTGPYVVASVFGGSSFYCGKRNRASFQLMAIPSIPQENPISPDPDQLFAS